MNSTAKRLKIKETAQVQDLQVDGSANIDDGLIVNNGLTVNNGATVNAGLTVNSATLLTGNLTVNGNTRLGNANADLLGFYTTSGVAQATTSGAAATFVVVSGTAVNTGSTFDGYTVGQVVRSLRNTGLLA